MDITYLFHGWKRFAGQRFAPLIRVASHGEACKDRHLLIIEQGYEKTDGAQGKG